MNAKTNSPKNPAYLLKPEIMSNPALLLKALIEAGFPAESFVWLSYVHQMKTLWDMGVVNMDSLAGKVESWDSYYAGWLSSAATQSKYLGIAHSDSEIKESYKQRAATRTAQKTGRILESSGVSPAVIPTLPATLFGDSTPAEYVNGKYGLAGKWTPALLEGFAMATQSQGLKVAMARCENMNSGKRLPAKQRAALTTAFNQEWKQRQEWLNKPKQAASPSYGKPATQDDSRLSNIESALAQLATLIAQQNAPKQETPASTSKATPRKRSNAKVIAESIAPISDTSTSK